jgi:hypothetical protein
MRNTNYDIQSSPYYNDLNKLHVQHGFSEAFAECMHKQMIYTVGRITELTKQELFASEGWKPEFWTEIEALLDVEEFWPGQ